MKDRFCSAAYSKIFRHYLQKLFLVLSLVMGMCTSSFAATEIIAPPLPAAKAFQLTVQFNPRKETAIAEWKISPGYYLYKNRLSFTVEPATAEIKIVNLPPGIPHEDTIFGKYNIYQDQLAVEMAIKHASALLITYQGCSSGGFCYPPISQKLILRHIEGSNLALQTQKHLSQMNHNIQLVTTSQHSILVILGFLILGFLLAFTPCVFPMLPILSGIIAGKNLTMSKAFYLSLTYVLSMAITYALAGLAVALIGINLQSYMQHPFIIASFALILVGLAFSLFGFYELQLPRLWRNRLLQINQNQKGGSYIGVATMGILSALIVSPCVSAPLVGALSYISQQANPILGFSALLALGLGMGFPLLLIGTIGGSFLPKAGTWMNSVKNLLGLSLLALAIWMLERIISSTVTHLLWALLLITASIFLYKSNPASKNLKWLWKGFCLLLLLLGLFFSINTLYQAVENSSSQTKPLFRTIKNIAALQNERQLALGHPVLIDFYADWCVSCKRLDTQVFADPKIKKALKNWVLLRADITQQNTDTQSLIRYFNVIAPPTLIFIDTTGKELQEKRIIGETGIEAFLKQIYLINLEMLDLWRG